MAYSMIQSGNSFTFASEVARMEVRPGFGFNCVRWDVRQGDDFVPVLYRTPDFESNPVPTRNGHPILFPFPNRMRNGRFTFEGREYQLPLTDNTGTHAIHGFTPRNAWRVVDAGESWITGEFCLSKDLPECRDCWPADCRIRINYRLFDDRLRVEAIIDAADGSTMPFGLGYHPYFTLGSMADDWTLQCPTRCLWETGANFPTATKLPIPAELDYSKAKPIGAVALDHPFGDLANGPIAVLANSNRQLTITVDPAFRELLLFVPPHRQAIAIEPYTCTTDAANLTTRGIDAGWRVLAAGETFTAVVEYRHSFLG